jgi:hypothetical protein
VPGTVLPIAPCDVTPLGFLMRRLLNSGTLGGRRIARVVWSRSPQVPPALKHRGDPPKQPSRRRTVALLILWGCSPTVPRREPFPSLNLATSASPMPPAPKAFYCLQGSFCYRTTTQCERERERACRGSLSPTQRRAACTTRCERAERAYCLLTRLKPSKDERLVEEECYRSRDACIATASGLYTGDRIRVRGCLETLP